MKTVALIVGHSHEVRGAGNKELGIYEYDFNKTLADKIAPILIDLGYNPVVVYRDTYVGLPAKVNQVNPDIAVSLHCNAFNTQASGSEVLHYDGSKKGKLLATYLQKSIVGVMRENDRGVKPISYGHVGKAGDRGGYLVAKTTMPTVIAEPFFIDNPDSLTKAQELMNELALAYATAIDNYFKE